MTPDTKARLASNLRDLPKTATLWVTTLVSMAASVYVSLPPMQQQQVGSALGLQPRKRLVVVSGSSHPELAGRIAIEFVAKLRDEQKFDDLPTLVAQMNRDAEQARAILMQHQPRATA